MPDFLRNMRAGQQHGFNHAVVSVLHKTDSIADCCRECSITSFPIRQSTASVGAGAEDSDSSDMSFAHHSFPRDRRSTNSTSYHSSGGMTIDDAINYFGIVVSPLKTSSMSFDL